MATVPGHRRLHEADRISALPDELLVHILHRLASTPAAVRTGVLSRRWRRLWAELTELRLDSVLSPVPGIDTVDVALAAACTSLRAVTRLRVSLDHLPPYGGGVSASRVASWLWFAAELVAGDLCILLPPEATGGAEEEEEQEDLHLPVCERVTEITLWLGGRFRLRLPAAGTFSALTYLNIRGARVDGPELEEFVFCWCPCLEELAVRLPRFLAGSEVCIRSDSLRRLDFHIEDMRQLEVAAPRLERLSLLNAVEAYIAAPELEEVVWEDESFDPLRHQFAGAGRHLRRLVVALSSPTAALLQRFDTVDELSVDISIPYGAKEYTRFLEDVDMIPSCAVLVVQSISTSHGSIPIVLHLLRRSTGIKKLIIYLEFMVNGLCRLLGCPCDLPESRRTDDINPDSLDEVEINLISDEAWSDEQAEFVELLLGCKAPVLKKVVINMSCSCPFVREDMFEKIREMCLLSNRFEFSVVCVGEEREESYSTVVIHNGMKRHLPLELMTFASLLEHEISHVH
uniref:F-box domain-containing protein n=1 Tax=Arundo donax TaxID=35708 RepID=A0A0A9A2D0_ARUDO